MTVEGVFARIALDDVVLAEAGSLVEDASYFEDTLPAVLHFFPQISLDQYWSLPVGVHRRLVGFLVSRGLYAES